MITFHPKHELIQAFVNGELPASLSIGIAAHNHFCKKCADTVDQLTQQVANQTFELDDTSDSDNSYDMEAMMNAITQDAGQAEVKAVDVPTITVNETKIMLPRAFNRVPIKHWNKMGTVSRARIDFNEEPLRSSLLHIAAGGVVPMHTHHGFELTLILDGSFEDAMGRYEAGDFIWLNGEHTHSPAASEDCLCYTVLDDSLQFTQGISKMLNPFGSLLY